LDQIRSDFEKRFSKNPYLFSSPGRINLIGEHTDYNDGFVLPAAINRRNYIAIKPNNIGVYRFYAANLSEEF